MIAFGGNALLRAGQKGTFDEQLENVERTCQQLVPLIEKGYDIVIGHGNGPQVGNALLRHEAGLSIRRGDPLFTTRDLMHIYHLKKAPDSRELVRIAVQRRLGYVPGKSYEYSNLGYLLLSMIIERKGGEPYEQWIQDNVLSPAGCEDMHLAYNYYKDKYPNEVRYYMQDNDPLVPEYNNSGDSVARFYA